MTTLDLQRSRHRTPGPWSDEGLDDLLLAETRAQLEPDRLRILRR